jgi:endonuclease V-like protein UPF0215 family
MRKLLQTEQEMVRTALQQRNKSSKIKPIINCLKNESLEGIEDWLAENEKEIKIGLLKGILYCFYNDVDSCCVVELHSETERRPIVKIYLFNKENERVVNEIIDFFVQEEYFEEAQIAEKIKKLILAKT